MTSFNQRKGEFVEITAAGTDGATAAQIPSLADTTVALIYSAPGNNGVRLPEGSVGDVIEIVSLSFEAAGGEVHVYHPDMGTFLGVVNGVMTFRRMPNSGGSISWMVISKL